MCQTHDIHLLKMYANIEEFKMDLSDRGPNSCSSLHKLSYGFGHIYNDLCAAMWFAYTLFYFQVVLEISSKTAGILLMIGQVIDAIATPIAGWLIDYTNSRKIWHFMGTIAVSIGFSLIFSLKTENNSVLLYYGLVITLFQTGWAIVQISHLSLIPEISRSHSHSSDLTAIRYTASVCCSVAVYFITLIILQNDSASTAIGPEDFYKFKEIALIITFVGILTSLLFYCGVLGLPDRTEYDFITDSDEDANNLGSNNKDKHFLKSSVIYLVSLLYMASRLFTILNLIYIPLYIAERAANEGLGTDGIRQKIATVPLVSYIASFITAVALKFKVNFCTDKVTYLLGSVIGVIACAWITSGIPLESDGQLYCIAILLGISGSATMVASLCLTANFVQTNGYGGGFVYSIVTFTDKLISGGVVLLVQNMQCTPRNLCPQFYEHVLSYICGGVSLIGLISLGALEVQIKLNGRRNG